jgi:membrane associated rhomboid family serine protease
MDEGDFFSPERRDPFYIPDRMLEIVLLLGGAAMAALLPFALAMPLTQVSIAVALSGAAGALLMVTRSMRLRRYRLRRKQAVKTLRANIRPLSE